VAAGCPDMMITHDLATAVQFADRLAVMYLGRIVEEGNSEGAGQRTWASVHGGADRRCTAAHAALRTEGQILTREPPSSIQVPSGCRFHPRCPVVTEPCSSVDPQLAPAGTGEAGHKAACILLSTVSAGVAGDG
jgi:peptide/nickel transport system ATP-binding protein